MATYAQMTDPALVPAYDFSPFRTVCDVGGGQGAFSQAGHGSQSASARHPLRPAGRGGEPCAGRARRPGRGGGRQLLRACPRPTC
ncbi:MAG: hypothetical protein IPF85_06395 [Anaerolineae bacterium]|nr:hypothetical protein [Anaerolineae bacterium]